MKEIFDFRFERPLLSAQELESCLSAMTLDQKVEIAQLARKIKPVLRCAPYKEVVDTALISLRYAGSPKSIKSIEQNGELCVDGPTFKSEKIFCSSYVTSRKGTILNWDKIVDEQNREYRNGFFAYANSGYGIFNYSYWGNGETVCRAPKLVKICEISTLHYSPYQDSFLPAEAEVLLQIPDILKNVVDAYELYLPNPATDQLIKDYRTFGQHHKAYARLFRLADGEVEPKKIREHYNRLIDTEIIF